MTALVFGASAGVGRCLARALAASGRSVILVARSERDLMEEARHIRTVYGVGVACVTVDATDPGRVVEQLRPYAESGEVRDLLFPLGMTEDADDGRLSAGHATAIVNANLTTIIAVVAAFLPGLLTAERANIVGFGSVASIRGRGSNIVYAAAKRGLESYFESLRHGLVGTTVVTQFYRLGYIETGMSYGQKLPFPVASPEGVARRAVKNLGRDVGRVHHPSFWVGIGLALRMTPWMIYRRVKF